jgi:hypothetical protein
VCQGGKADTYGGAIAGGFGQALGVGCTKQVQAGIVQLNGCLTEYDDSLNVLIEGLQVPGHWEEVLDTHYPLNGIPDAEAFQFEQDIIMQYFHSRGCSPSLPKRIRELLGCSAIPGSTDQDPFSCDYPGDAGCSDSGSPAPVSSHHAPERDPRAGAASSFGGVQLTAGIPVPPQNVEFVTPCNPDVTEPKPHDAMFVHPCVRLFVTSQPVMINGLTFVPDPGSVILVSPEFKIVVTTGASVWMGKLKLRDSQPYNLQVPDSFLNPWDDFAALTVPDLGAVIASHPEIAALPVEKGGLMVGGLQSPGGAMHTSFGDHTTHLTYTVTLPRPLAAGPDGGAITATVYVELTSDGQPHIAGGVLEEANVWLGPVQLKHFTACFREAEVIEDFGKTCPAAGVPMAGSYSSFWGATGELDYLGLSLLFKPPGPDPVTCPFTYGIGVGDGHLVFAGAALSAPAGGVPVFPGVNLSSLGASFTAGAAATTLCAYANFSAAGGLVHMLAQLFAVWTHGTPYHFTGNELGPGMPPRVGADYPFTNDFALGAGGELFVHLPGFDDIPIGGGYMLYVHDPQAVFFGAHFTFSIPTGGTPDDPPDRGIAMDGGLDGGIGLGDGWPFYLVGHARVVVHFCVVDGHICGTPIDVGADGIISRDSGGGGGVGFCAHISGVSTGVTYHWGDGFGDLLGDVHLWGCDFSSYSTDVEHARDASAGVYRVRVPRGVSAVDYLLQGPTGAPDVTIDGHGISVSTRGAPDSHLTVRGDVCFERLEGARATYMALRNPKPGVYTITANPGSPAISSIRRASGFTPSVVATVAGHGIHRTLRYRIAPHPGLRIIFIEQSTQTRRILGSPTSTSGSLGLLAVPGQGRRYISAEVLQDGSPTEVLRVTSYLPPPRQRLGAVKWVRVRRAGSTARVTFASVPGARLYRVLLETRDGTLKAYLTGGGPVTIPGLWLRWAGRVTVSALGDSVYTLDGAASRAGLPAAVIPLAKRSHRRG